MATDKLLVTTAFEETWGDAEEIIFLGEWCKAYGRRHAWAARRHETIPFHWDNRDKLKSDYDYLEALHHRLLKSLAVSLNELHQVEYSKRYWQILLDPWLMTYVGVMFDRWESLRGAFDCYAELKTVAFEGYSAHMPARSYSDFITQAISDRWNHAVCLRIIEFQYGNRCVVTKSEGGANAEGQGTNEEMNASPRESLRSKILSGAEKFLDKFCPRYDAVFVGAYFPLVPLIRLNLSLGQFPRLFLHDFEFPAERLDILWQGGGETSERSAFNCDFQSKTDFENFLSRVIRFDLPICVMEGYHAVRKHAASLSVKTKAIVTAHSHWNDFAAKAWFAEQVDQGTKLVVLEHGGSLPAYKELFDFEEDISDVRGTWFLPYHAKHRQLPPSRLINRFSRRQSAGKYCSIIGNECPRWAYRAHFYPMASQGLESVKLVNRLYAGLRGDIQECVRVKPAPSNDWNTREIYTGQLGAHKLYSGMSIDRVFAQSRLAICTYPETTFSEAMTSGVPTVMIYPEHYYERHPVTGSLLKLLRDSQIIFHDSQAAATHINAIWDDVETWWNSSEILAVRKEFYRQACKLDSSWLKEWKTFLAEVVA